MIDKLICTAFGFIAGFYGAIIFFVILVDSKGKEDDE